MQFVWINQFFLIYEFFFSAFFFRNTIKYENIIQMQIFQQNISDDNAIRFFINHNE